MAKQVLDLYELYRLVVARGGLVEVINKKIWREITKGLNLPSSITSAAFTLRTQWVFPISLPLYSCPLSPDPSSSHIFTIYVLKWNIHANIDICRFAVRIFHGRKMLFIQLTLNLKLVIWAKRETGMEEG